MAGKLTRRQSERTKAAIRTTMIVGRLQGFIEGKRQMTGAQVNAALGLLSYALPKPVQTVEQTGEITVRWKS